MSVSDQPTEYRTSNDRSPGPDARVAALAHGLVGGVVAVLLSFFPLSAVLGGGVAGYLDRGAGRRGTAAGAIAGLVAFVPYLLVGLYLALAPGVALPGPALAAPAVVVAGVAGFGLVYTVGLSVLGGLLGGYLADERSA